MKKLLVKAFIGLALLASIGGNVLAKVAQPSILFQTSDLAGSWNTVFAAAGGTGAEAYVGKGSATYTSEGVFNSSFKVMDDVSENESGTRTLGSTGVLTNPPQESGDFDNYGLMLNDKNVLLHGCWWETNGNATHGFNVSVKQTGVVFSDNDLVGSWHTVNLSVGIPELWVDKDLFVFNADHTLVDGGDTTWSLNSTTGALDFTGDNSEAISYVTPDKEMFVFNGHAEGNDGTFNFGMAVKSASTGFEQTDIAGEWDYVYLESHLTESSGGAGTLNIADNGSCRDGADVFYDANVTLTISGTSNKYTVGTTEAYLTPSKTVMVIISGDKNHATDGSRLSILRKKVDALPLDTDDQFKVDVLEGSWKGIAASEGVNKWEESRVYTYKEDGSYTKTYSKLDGDSGSSEGNLRIKANGTFEDLYIEDDGSIWYSTNIYGLISNDKLMYFKFADWDWSNVQWSFNVKNTNTVFNQAIDLAGTEWNGVNILSNITNNSNNIGERSSLTFSPDANSDGTIDTRVNWIGLDGSTQEKTNQKFSLNNNGDLNAFINEDFTTKSYMAPNKEVIILISKDDADTKSYIFVKNEGSFSLSDINGTWDCLWVEVDKDNSKARDDLITFNGATGAITSGSGEPFYGAGAILSYDSSNYFTATGGSYGYMTPSKDMMVFISGTSGTANSPRMSILRKRVADEVAVAPVVGGVGTATGTDGTTSGTDVTFTGTPEVDGLKLFIPTGTNISSGVFDPTKLVATLVNGTLGDLEKAGSVFEFGPSGATFDPAVEITFPVSAAFALADVTIYYYNQTTGLWERGSDAGVTLLPISATNTANHTRTAQITHFSVFAPGAVSAAGSSSSTSSSSDDGSGGGCLINFLR